MAEEKQVRGRDIAAPLDTLEVSGKQYKLAFTNETFRLAEEELRGNRHGLDAQQDRRNHGDSVRRDCGSRAGNGDDVGGFHARFPHYGNSGCGG